MLDADEASHPLLDGAPFAEKRRVGDTIAGHFQIPGRSAAARWARLSRTRDTNLNRDVALEMLPPAFTRDVERLVQFRREAQLLARLNRPNIGDI